MENSTKKKWKIKRNYTVKENINRVNIKLRLAKLDIH